MTGLLALFAAAARAEEPPVAADAATLRDFMIQDVCLDPAGAVVPGVAPIGGDSRCAGERDLRLGEPLPYHKHDQPSPADRAVAPQGYQRHDSVPIETAGFGRTVEHSFDFGAGEGRRFGVFDRGSDGGDIAVLSPGTAAIAATEDGGAGFQLFVGLSCHGAVDAAALAHSWIVALFDAARPGPLAGETTARLNDLTAGHQQHCPDRFNAAFTRWHVAPFRYRVAPGQGPPAELTTLISEHYGGADPVTADHVERFYFTRELGGTRWERWQNVWGNAQFSAAAIAAQAAGLAATGRCSAPDPPAGTRMLLVDCREWTRIVPPDSPAGDRPGFFTDAIRARPDAPPFLAPPSRRGQ
ncbi:MAG TPA: hypothetical protein VJR70_06715 [Stellaceae bacterium]|nr:hypothetical protein [Stellaceae bacterium]